MFVTSEIGENAASELTEAKVTVKLNQDFGVAGMSSADLQAVVAAWQSGAISRDTMFELFRSGEILPDGRTNQDEEQLIKVGRGVPTAPTSPSL
jgi:hypothetical protein